MGEEHHQPTKNRHKSWDANPSEQWAFALQHMDAGEWDLAITHCQRAITIFPTYYDAWLLMAGAHEEKGDLDGALQAAERASEIAIHELSQAWSSLAALHMVREEYEDAITIDRVLCLVDPSRQAISSYRMGISYTVLGDFSSAERFLREAIEHRRDLYDRALEEPLLSPHHEWLRQDEQIVQGRDDEISDELNTQSEEG